MTKLEILYSLLNDKDINEESTIRKLIDELVEAGNEMKQGLSEYSNSGYKWREFGCLGSLILPIFISAIQRI